MNLDDLHSAFARLAQDLKDDGSHDAELVLVDDGSRDSTWALIVRLVDRDDRVQGIQLSRNFGHQAAVTCGYENARGEAVVSLDADLQDPLEVVSEMVHAWQNGADIVTAVRVSRSGETIFKRSTAWFFYWFINKLGATSIRRNAGDFRLLSRRALEVLNQISGSRPFLRESTGWIGFPSAEIRYARCARQKGETKFTIVRMCSLALDAVVAGSTRPLYFSLWCGGFVFAAALLMVFAPDWMRLSGLMSPVAAVLICTSLLLFGQGIHGVYLSRAFEEIRGRPRYIVANRVSRASTSARNMTIGGHTEGESVHESG